MSIDINYLSFFPPPIARLMLGPTVTSPSVGMRTWIPILKCLNSSTPNLGATPT